MKNHTVDSCFKKYGYLPLCKQIGTINHYADVPGTTDASLNDSNEYNEQVLSNFAFTFDQHKVMLALLQGTSSSSFSQAHNINHLTTQVDNGSSIICTIPSSHKLENFILDIGVTYHVCHTKTFFQCIKQINPITIKLPNGALITTNYASTIHFDKCLYIIDVLYMPDIF